MSWKPITTIQDTVEIIAASYHKPQLILKHSTRCGLSSTAKFQLDEELQALTSVFDLHFLDLLKYREVSNHIAEVLDVPHASPQVIAVSNGKATYDLSHALVTPRFILDYQERELV